MKVNTSVRKIKDMIENWRAQDFFKGGGPWRKRIWNPLYKRVSCPPPKKKKMMFRAQQALSQLARSTVC